VILQGDKSKAGFWKVKKKARKDRKMSRRQTKLENLDNQSVTTVDYSVQNLDYKDKTEEKSRTTLNTSNFESFDLDDVDIDKRRSNKYPTKQMEIKSDQNINLDVFLEKQKLQEELDKDLNESKEFHIKDVKQSKMSSAMSYLKDKKDQITSKTSVSKEDQKARSPSKKSESNVTLANNLANTQEIGTSSSNQKNVDDFKNKT
jgi:hypothetical protein